jgi:hypothetical protein
MSANPNEITVQLGVVPGEVKRADSSVPQFIRGGKTGEMMVSLTHGKYYEAALRGKLHYSYAAAIAMSASATSAVGNIIWNPPGSGINAVLARWDFANVVTDTNALELLLGYSVQATVPGSVTAAVTGPCLLGAVGTPTSLCKAYSVATITTAATAIASLAYIYAAIDTVGQGQIQGDFDGSIIIPPGYLIHLMCAVAAGTAGTYSTLYWEEVPII